MRKLVVLSFITLDGVMQAPGGPEEDPTGGFKHGGWVAGYFDDFLGKVMAGQMSRPFDLLLGRKTYEIFAAHWPYVQTNDDPIAAGINKAKKYVASKTLIKPDWSNSELLKGDVAEEVKRLKEQDGPEIQVHGSSNLIQTLLKHDLVDELWLKTFPITLGRGKRLFAEGTIPVGFKLLESQIAPSGVIVAAYVRAGEVKTGSFALEVPTEVELTRRKRLAEEKMAMDTELSAVVREIEEKLSGRNLKLGVAESCTGGFLSNAITNIPGASKFFKLSVVSYSEDAKKSVLGISSSIIKKHGTVSEETAVAMMEGVMKLGQTDVALSVTGVAGPEAIEDKEVGLVFIAAAVGDRVESQGFKFSGDREEIKRQASLEALRFLKRSLDIWL